MKQYISVLQLSQLSDQGKKKLLMWERSKKYDNFDDYAERVGKEPSTLSELSIGRMIEFLDNVDIDVRLKHGKQKDLGYINGNRREKEFADALWEAVKEVLEK